MNFIFINIKYNISFVVIPMLSKDILDDTQNFAYVSVDDVRNVYTQTSLQHKRSRKIWVVKEKNKHRLKMKCLKGKKSKTNVCYSRGLRLEHTSRILTKTVDNKGRLFWPLLFGRTLNPRILMATCTVKIVFSWHI